MKTLWKDLQCAFRTLVRNPGFTVVVVVVLALGIGAVTAIFTVVDGVLISPLLYRDPERLLTVWSANPSQGMNQAPVSPPDFREWRDNNKSFERMGAYYFGSFNLGAKDQPERVEGAIVSADFIPLLGVQPALGRSFSSQEEQFGNHRVVLLTFSLWQRRFAGDPGLLGQALKVNGEDYTVVGILPQKFQFPNRRIELCTPMAFEANDERNTRGDYFLRVIARLKPGVTAQQSQADLAGICLRIEEENPASGGFSATVVPLREEIVGGVRNALSLLFGAVGLLLLIACANVANLLLAHNIGRRTEIAVRAALGASPGRVIRQLLTESLLLSLLAAAAGILIAFWGIHLLVGFSPASLPRLEEITVNMRVLGFSVGLALLTGVVFGLFAALPASKLNLQESLRGAGSSLHPATHRRFRNALVVCEVALAMVLVIAASLFIQSFFRMEKVNPGFQPDDVLTFSVDLPESRYPEAAQSTAFFQELLERLQALPGVRYAGVSSDLPLTIKSERKYLSFSDRPPARSLEEVPVVYHRAVSKHYFQAMGIPLLRGAFFIDSDKGESQGVAIISEALAQIYWPGADPVGRIIWMGPPESLVAKLIPPGFQFPRLKIVGVVGDVKSRALDKDGGPEVYALFLQSQQPVREMNVVVRTASDPMSLAAAVKSQVWAIDETQPVSSIKTLKQIVAGSLEQQRFNADLLAIFAGVALVLAAVGIYGVISYTFNQRTHEMGVRIALGAQPNEIFKLVVGEGMRLTLAGIFIGLVAAFGLTRLLSSLLFGLSATDPMTFGVVSVLLALVALFACYFPARRATAVDPIVALRGR
jgi:putative ABC transport system permease protein